MLKEFKEFAFKGNVIDLAVGVIIGGAFGKIVASLVNDVLMPIIGIMLGGINFTNLKFVITPASENVAESSIYYVNFFQSIVYFLIIAISVFFFVRLISLAKKKEEIVEKVAEPVKTDEVLLLEEIRDLLKK